MPMPCIARFASVLAITVLACGCSGVADRSDSSVPGAGDESAVLPAGSIVRYSEQREACADRNPHRNAYFGDLNIHTSYSYDARALGLTTTPEDAYRYARGEAIALPPREAGGPETMVQRTGAPLDFAAVTDHSEFLGELRLCADENSAAYHTQSCATYRKGEPPAILVMAREISRDAPARNAEICGKDGGLCLEAAEILWQRTQQMAEHAYDRSSRCAFTSFVAYEHSGTPDNNAYHRNVIFRNDRVPRLPISYFDAPTDIELWDRLTSECLEGLEGCDALAIPHSSNLSSGALFSSAPAGPDTRENARRVAQRRNALEPVMEILQHKGSSECFNGFPDILGAPDSLCDMEQLRRYFRGLPAEGNAPPICEEGETGRGATLNIGCVSKNDFFRSVLLTGLQREVALGENPFKFGAIGSTDTHVSTAGAVDEAGWEGHTVSEIDLVERLTPSRVHASGLYTNPGGLAGIWAVENSRDALFDALKRREVFGTSGPRIKPRFFGGWDYPDNACETDRPRERGHPSKSQGVSGLGERQDDLVGTKHPEAKTSRLRGGRDVLAPRWYAGGVPMGRDLPARSSGGAPRFIAAAERDAESAPLLRLQVIKGWLDESSLAHYKVFDVAGDAESSGSIDPESGTWTGPGHESLCVVFEDPDFDPEQPSYYYMRAVEAPSLRWSWRQCLEMPPDQRPAECENTAPKVIQELTWSSPIWYRPKEYRTFARLEP